MKRNFNRDFLREEKRYSSFPVDFLKAETIFFPEKFVYFYLTTPYIRHKSSYKREIFRFLFHGRWEKPKICLKGDCLVKWAFYWLAQRTQLSKGPSAIGLLIGVGLRLCLNTQYQYSTNNTNNLC